MRGSIVIGNILQLRQPLLLVKTTTDFLQCTSVHTCDSVTFPVSGGDYTRVCGTTRFYSFQGAHCTDPIMVLKRLLLMVPMFLVLVLHMAAVHDNTFTVGASKVIYAVRVVFAIGMPGIL